VLTKYAAVAHVAEEKLLKHGITCDEEKDPRWNSVPVMFVEGVQDLESPHQKIK